VSDDPFEDLDPDAYRDREGDPFEYLGGGPSADEDRESPSGPDEETDEHEAASVTGDTDRTVDVSGEAFGDVDVSRGDPFESADSPFRQVDVDSVDPDEVWERFTGGAERAEQTPTETLGGEEVADDAADVVEVPKGRFCQTCPHFSAPPETTCNHPGTEILTFVDSDEVRVSNCPVVRERRELGETYD
jgi:hypothetical protein